ncbi:MAG TPA: O-antigen ligase family protein [Vicinamibacterales bacterium]|nr:O-antigen ligase family protein [Vicinamibacterales bacterium]
MVVPERRAPAAAAVSIGRVTRVAVVTSLVAALAVQVSVVARGAPAIEIPSLVAFLSALLVSVAFPRLGPALVLSSTYVAPVAIAAVVGSRDSSFLCVWLAALTGPIVPTVVWREWRFPNAWKRPLVFWLLCIAAVWPLIILRECNFDPRLWRSDVVSTSSIGISPAIEALGITHDVLTLGLPLLWLDWLFGTFTADRLKGLIRWVIAPLAASWLICASVGLYQGFVDVLFLNGGLFGYMGRASGTMLDANPFGVISAIWGPALLALAVGTRRRMPIVGGVAALLLSWVGVWASGSRTAIATAGIILLFLVWQTVHATRVRHARAWLLAGASALLVAAGLAVAAGSSTQVSGFSRLRATVPSLSFQSIRAFGTEMWNRNHYGDASTQMILEHPLVGVGLGSFSTLVVDYGKQSNGGEWLTPDNAQNWYRHQLAQMGIVGSVGWMIWLGLLAAFFRRTARNAALRERRFEAGAITGALVGVAVVSLVGMPTANTAAALTAMVFVFWYAALADPAIDARSLSRSSVPRIATMRQGLAAGALLVAFLAGTLFVGWARLRPPQRALRFGWEYVSGFYDHEQLSRDTLFRWTAGHAMDVFPVRDRYLRLRYWVHHPDVERRPVHVDIWLQNRHIVDEMLKSVAPVTEYVRLWPDDPRMMLEARVSRTWKPSDYGEGDTRDLGLAFEDWAFVSEPPAGAKVITDVPRSPRSR